MDSGSRIFGSSSVALLSIVARSTLASCSSGMLSNSSSLAAGFSSASGSVSFWAVVVSVKSIDSFVLAPVGSLVVSSVVESGAVAFSVPSSLVASAGAFATAESGGGVVGFGAGVTTCGGRSVGGVDFSVKDTDLSLLAGLPAGLPAGLLAGLPAGLPPGLPPGPLFRG